MRTYGTIHITFWTDPKIKSLSVSAKLLAIYLLTGTHTTMLGCFRLPIGYVCEDLNLDSETVSQGLEELSQINFLRHDQQNDWVLINNFLNWSKIENPNQGKGIQKLFGQVPQNTCFYGDFLDILRSQTKNLDTYFISQLETLSQEFRNQDQNQ